MKKRKITEEVNRQLQEAERRRRAPAADSEIAETLRLHHGIVDRRTLLKLCPWLNIQGAIELGLLVERKAGDGQQTYIAGPKLHEGKCDLAKAINIGALVEQVARSG